MGDLISVIIPVYNVEKYLERCVNSVLSQSYKNIEVILVDDGSPDNSGKMCDEFAEKDSRIKVIHTHNGGLSYARNVGIKISTGNYICFVDSDDWIEPHILENSHNRLINDDLDVVIWGFYKDFVDVQDSTNSFIKINIGDYYCSKYKNDNEILLNDNALALVGYAWNKLYKRDLIVSNNLQFLESVSLVEDMLFNSEVLSKSDKIAFIDDIGYHYVQRNRETLGAKFYPNYFDLKIKACDAVEKLLTVYNIEAVKISNVVMYRKFYGLVSSCRMVCLTKTLSSREKKSYMKKVCSSNNGKSVLKNIHVNGKNLLYKIILSTKQFWVFEVLYSR